MMKRSILTTVAFAVGGAAITAAPAHAGVLNSSASVDRVALDTPGTSDDSGELIGMLEGFGVVVNQSA